MPQVLDPETGIYESTPLGRWPLHIGRPVSSGYATWYKPCPTPYVQSFARDIEAFRKARDAGRQVCTMCADWVDSHES